VLELFVEQLQSVGPQQSEIDSRWRTARGICESNFDSYTFPALHLTELALFGRRQVDTFVDRTFNFPSRPRNSASRHST